MKKDKERDSFGKKGRMGVNYIEERIVLAKT